MLLLAVGMTAIYLAIAISRITYPYDLDFIENAMLLQAWRGATGQAVYLPPNADFVPQVYMPLYTWIGGLLLKLTGPVLWPLRLISLTSVLLTAVILYFVSRREQAGRVIAISCAALFLAGFRLSGGWYDLARVDALFGLLVIAGMAAAIYGHRTRLGLALAGALMGLTILTKQNGLIIAVVVAAYLIYVSRAKIIWYLAPLGVLAILPSVWLQLSTDGWFGYYVLGIAYASPVDPGRILPTLTREFLGAMGGLIVLLGLAIAFQLRHRSQRSHWLLMIAVAVFVSVAGRASVGGNLNNLMLGYTLLCLSPALAAKALSDRTGNRHLALYLAVALLIIAQYVLAWRSLPYAPRQFVPDATMRASGDALISYLASTEGDVWVMLHPAYALWADKAAAVHIQSLWHGRQRGQEPLPPDLIERISTHYYARIISDESPYFETEPQLLELLDQYYRREPLDESLSPRTLSGIEVRPRSVYVPKGDSGGLP
ncbi:MAG: glycosyltransferase family 39 protein [Caldilineales bacterium]|nr:glycosyltransferase family 39 protein [Caldilineales bacterium]